jgi:hypothetical protein
MLDAYREYIKEASRREELSNVLEHLNAKGYKTIEKGYKKYPRGFSADMPSVDLSLYKGMATYKILEPKLIENGELLIDTLYKIYEDMLPLQQIVYEISLRVKEK